jgi:hypothetical protein
MPEARAKLHALLAALVRRERALLTLRALLQGLAGLAGAALLAVLLQRLPLPRGLARGLLFGAAVALPLVGLALPVLTRWRQAGSPVRQALLVETLRPGLRGRLVTLAERLEGPRRGESAALLELAARRAGELLGSLASAEVHPLRGLRSPTLVLVGLGLLCALSSLLGSGPGQALHALLRSPQAQAAAPRPSADQERDLAVLGDIVLRYRYPDYTGLEPLEVPNSTGDVHAPPGTLVEIRARTARSWLEAELLVERAATAAYDASTLRSPARLEGGRDLLGSFELVAPGSWSFTLRGDQEELSSASHRVVLDLDQPPELLLSDAEGVIEVAWDAPVPIGWTARDDYGVVHVEVVLAEDPAHNHSLRKPLDPARRLEGRADFTPGDLGLQPGAETRLVIQAWDNDAVGGSKAGRSPQFRVRVLGPRGQSARRPRVVQQLRDALLLVLADHLEDPWPPEPERAVVRSWGASAARRMEPVEQLVEDAWQGYEPEGFEGTVIAAVRRSQASLVGFVNALGPTGNGVKTEDLETLASLREALVHDLEQGVLTLDLVVRQLAMKALVERVEALDAAAARLEAMADAAPWQVLARLDRLARQLDQVEAAAEQLGDSSLAHFTQHRLRDVRHISEAVRRAHAAGQPEDAAVYQQRLVRELRAFAEQFGQLRQRQQELEQELADRMKALAEEIESMLAGQDGQRRLLDELLVTVARAGDPQEALSGRWDRLAQQAESLGAELEAFGGQLMGHEGRSASEWRLAQRASGEALRLSEALAARDLGRALEAAAETEWALQRLRDSIERHAAHAELLDMPLPEQAAVEGRLRAAVASSSALRGALDGLLLQLASEPGRLRGATDALTARQDALRQRAEAALIEARQLLGQLPMEAPGLEEGLERAASEMGSATDALPRGEARAAEGAQRAAIQGLEEALEALRQAQQDAQDMSQMGESSSGEQAQKGGGSGDERHRQPRSRVEIPTPEEFRTPEAYRQALLEGMQAEVPPEYRALERRYYEDLVRQ